HSSPGYTTSGPPADPSSAPGSAASPPLPDEQPTASARHAARAAPGRRRVDGFPGDITARHASGHADPPQCSLAMLTASSASASVARNAAIISSASAGEVRRNPRARTLASFHRRAPAAVSGSVHRAARTPGTLLAAIDTPVPVQQHTTPRSAPPPATASPTRRPTSGQGSPSPTTTTS